jgi:hypothetical protein
MANFVMMSVTSLLRLKQIFEVDMVKKNEHVTKEELRHKEIMEKLEKIDRHYREAEAIAHKEILDEINENDRVSIFYFYVGIALALSSVAVSYGFFKETLSFAVFYLIFGLIVIGIGWILASKKVYYKLKEWKKIKINKQKKID